MVITLIAISSISENKIRFRTCNLFVENNVWFHQVFVFESFQCKYTEWIELNTPEQLLNWTITIICSLDSFHLVKEFANPTFLQLRVHAKWTKEMLFSLLECYLICIYVEIVYKTQGGHLCRLHSPSLSALILKNVNVQRWCYFGNSATNVVLKIWHCLYRVFSMIVRTFLLCSISTNTHHLNKKWAYYSAGVDDLDVFSNFELVQNDNLIKKNALSCKNLCFHVRSKVIPIQIK